MEIPMLEKMYATLHPDWVRLLLRPFVQFPVPTEMIVQTSGSYSPIFARSYDTDWFVDEGILRTYDQLIEGHGAMFRGTYAFDPVRFVEVWEDQGSDGHVEFRLVGWRFIGRAALVLTKDILQTTTGLPLAMTTSWEAHRNAR